MKLGPGAALWCGERGCAGENWLLRRPAQGSGGRSGGVCLVAGLEGRPALGKPDRPSRCFSKCRSGEWTSQEVGAGAMGAPSHSVCPLQERKVLRMLTEAGAPELQRHDAPTELLQPLVPRYEAALAQLEEAVRVSVCGGSRGHLRLFASDNR